MAAAALVGLLFLSAISTADKFDEENYGVKVRQAHVEYLCDNSSKMQHSLSVRRRVRGVQDREHGAGRDARRDGGKVGHDRDRLQRRKGEEENKVRIVVTQVQFNFD